jgi:energy-coupling factor transporter ATP-binding protein EcfA2
MNILQDIFQWSTSLKPWQSDAIRRLLRKQTLDEQDYDDLYAMLKSAYGIPDSQNRIPQQLSASDLPSLTSQAQSTVLHSMRDLCHVNRIAEKQCLKFVPTGLTIVYGDNGSGKSGYSRVLKRACRARDQEEKVLPNAHLPQAQQGVPEAFFDVEIAGVKATLRWEQNKDAPEELSGISVFDSRCARAYLDEEQDVAYVPYGLDIVQSLGLMVLPTLGKRLETEIRACVIDRSAFADLQGTTVVGKLITDLSAKTEKRQIESLAILTPEENKRRVEVEEALRAENPRAKAQTLRRISQRLSTVLSKITAAATLVGNTAIARLRAIDETAEAACAAETIAARQFRECETFLPGTGGQEWQQLFIAARKFSTIAYPDRPFPVVSPGARCPLCQQELADGGPRMCRFDEFLRNETAKNATQKRKEREQAKTELLKESISFGLDATLLEELAPHDASIGPSLQKLEQVLKEQQKCVGHSFDTHQWDSIPAITGDARQSSQLLIDALAKQADALEKAADDQLRQTLQRELDELNARVKLGPRKQSVLDAIDKLQVEAKLKLCQDDVKTRPVSDKSKELTQKAVTQALRDAIDCEFKALGVDHLKTKLSERTSSGKTLHKLTLDLPKSIRLPEVLSEGELRSIAIASFLAEISLSGHKGGLVFDDPVSSLDHIRRIKVAERIVKEAMHRQVIIFTHDTVFLGELQDQIEKQGCNKLIHHLVWASRDHAGQCVEGLPWHHQPYKDRIDKLEKAQRQLSQNWQPYPNDEQTAAMCHAYSRFRATLERVIQDLVFNGVVQRYCDWIKVGNLRRVVGFTQGECDEIDRLHKIACDVTEAHDHSTARNAPVPDPSQLDGDIAALKALIEIIKKRQPK